MFLRNDMLNVTWKGFLFPMSVREFSISEDAKVATYEYAGRNGAEHERVMNYRVFSVSGVFSEDSGNETPDYYANKLRSLNDNKPGQFIHPNFGAFKCIMKGLSITQSGDNNEYGDGGSIINNYSFQFELRETSDPNLITLSDKINQLFPAVEVRPQSNYYKTTLKYNTCDQLYMAIVEGKIEAGTDPIRHSEWLLYPYDMRVCAFGKRQANPNGVSTKTVDNSSQNLYTVVAGDYGIKIAKEKNIAFDRLFKANQGRKVRTVARADQGLYWKNANKLRPGDLLVIPN